MLVNKRKLKNYSNKEIMIDWHSHILPGLDDGAADIEQSLLMAYALSAAGFTTVYCTPHLMRGCYEAGNDQVRRGVAELQERLDSSAIPLTLLAGREYCLDEYLPAALEDPLPLGDSRLILIEILPHTTADMIRELVYHVVRSGFTPVIAHPERCPLLEPRLVRKRSGLFDAVRSMFTRTSNPEPRTSNPEPRTLNPEPRTSNPEPRTLNPEPRTSNPEPRTSNPEPRTSNSLLDYLRDLGCSFQGNLGSFNGFYGRQVKDTANELRRLGIYDRYGSDLHAPEQAARVLQPLLIR